MKMLIALWCGIGFALLAAPQLAAEVQVRLSIKFIRGSDGEFPDQPGAGFPTAVNLNSTQAVRDNIAFINQLLARRGESFRFFLRDDIVYSVRGRDDPWFDIDARDKTNASNLESTATADASTKIVYIWHDDSINVYINNSTSGVCSFPGGGNIILAGAGAYQELLIHEIGHFFSLRHTHPGDDDGDIDDWADNDGFSETLDDDSDATATDINDRYTPQFSRETRENLIFNIMSYHLPQDRFVWQQRQALIETYNGARDFQVSGEGRFVKSDGDDGSDGRTWNGRLETLAKAVELTSGSNDVVLIDGEQNVANGTVFSKAMTWLKWRNNALIK